MGHAKELLINTANIATLIALGVCYPRIIQFGLSLLYSHSPKVLSSAEKMMLTGAAAAIAIAVVFLFNRLVTRQSMMWLGLSCGALAFSYFYIIKFWPDPYQAILVLFSSYSLFALLAFTIAPVLVGVLWHRRQKFSGFHFRKVQRQ